MGGREGRGPPLQTEAWAPSVYERAWEDEKPASPRRAGRARAGKEARRSCRLHRSQGRPRQGEEARRSRRLISLKGGLGKARGLRGGSRTGLPLPSPLPPSLSLSLSLFLSLSLSFNPSPPHTLSVPLPIMPPCSLLTLSRCLSLARLPSFPTPSRAFPSRFPHSLPRIPLGIRTRGVEEASDPKGERGGEGGGEHGKGEAAASRGVGGGGALGRCLGEQVAELEAQGGRSVLVPRLFRLVQLRLPPRFPAKVRCRGPGRPQPARMRDGRTGRLRRPSACGVETGPPACVLKGAAVRGGRARPRASAPCTARARGAVLGLERDSTA